MNIFRRLDYQEVIYYKVPELIAKDPDNIFFGIERNPFDLDGPWPFLAFVINEKNPKILTFHICDIYPEALEYADFNPLDSTGFLYLTKEGFNDLLSIIDEVKNQYFPDKKLENQGPSFKRIKGKELRKLRIDDRKFPKNRQIYYLQVDKSIGKSDQIYSVLYFSWELQYKKNKHAMFKIMSFSKEMLENEGFDPEDYGLAYIALDKNGLNQLSETITDISNQIS
jgi:hypothetical protein